MQRFTLLAALLFLAASLPAQTRPYSQLYVFGDSYSDSGFGYVDTNGPTAVVYLAQRLGIPFTYYGDPASHGKGLNLAVSGAGSGTGAGRHYPTGEFLGFGVRNQVDQFAAFLKTGDIPAFDPAQTMFFFAAGLNDRGKPEGYTRTNLEAEIETLYALGARRFMVALLPTKIPAFAAAGEQINPELARVPAEEVARHPDMRIANSNWGGFFDEVITHPAKYGIADTTSTCAGRTIHHEDPAPCASPQTHFYYHEGHPSTAAHKAVGELLYTEAVGKLP
jgi:phospholipase/lecithinase/hemolysin